MSDECGRVPSVFGTACPMDEAHYEILCNEMVLRVVVTTLSDVENDVSKLTAQKLKVRRIQ